MAETVRYKSVLHEIYSSIQRVGVQGTAYLGLSRIYDHCFDAYYQVDTGQRMELDELEIDAATEKQGQMYQPTGVLPFKRIVQKIQFPEPSVFIDYGSGKGRTLLVAACERMKRVVGIEFSRELCDIAEANVELFRKKRVLTTPIEIVHEDAANFVYQGDENIFYFFYPFDAALMTKVIKAIEDSLKATPREAVLLYYYPIHRSVLDESTVFKLEDTLELYGYQCLVYRYDGR